MRPPMLRGALCPTCLPQLTSTPTRTWTRSPLSSSPRLQARRFSTTTPRTARQDHYATLKLPRNATKAQIKARFYELSRKTHPDTPGGSPSAFHTINDAYAVLGDEGARMAYDRTLTPASQRSTPGFHPHSPQARRAAGPHRAWGGGGSSMGDGYGTWGKAAPGPAWSGRRKVDPDLGWGMGLGGAGGRNTTGNLNGMPWGKRESPKERANREKRYSAMRLDEEVKGESAGWRLLVVLLLMACILGLGGGFTTSSGDTGEDEDERGEGEGLDLD